MTIIGLTGLVHLCLARLPLAELCLAVTVSPLCLATETAPSVTVGAYAQHVSDKIVYQYRVNNNSQQTVAAVSIGRNRPDENNPASDLYELFDRPSGWNPRFGIPTTSYNAPTGWRASLLAADEQSANHAITWEPLNNRSPKLFAGQSMSKLSITLDKADSNYLTGHALITFADGSPSTLTIPIKRLDNTAPALNVILTPETLLAQNDKPVAVKAGFTVQDDFDQMPSIRLESITPNEPGGADEILDANPGLDDRYFKFRTDPQIQNDRSYTVTYSTTDASGNQTLASATVTVTAKHVRDQVGSLLPNPASARPAGK